MNGKSDRRTIKYAAFLRGINVGGHKTVVMEDLKKAFASLGFQNVKTVLASGNVLFEAGMANPTDLSRQIGAYLEKTFGFEIGIVVRTIDGIQQLVDSQPFKNISVTPQIRLYVTFTSEKPRSAFKIPFESPGKGLKILRFANGAVLSVVALSAGKGTIDLMGVLEKEFGKNITTRNWNTIIKMVENSYGGRINEIKYPKQNELIS
ncbi:MAG: DUF1697 domain-containing protein [Chitinivibrionales bacterium]